MGIDHNDIYSIVERLRILEEGLDKNQKSVNQLSATFKPKTVAVLTAKTDPKNPMAGKLVGSSESIEDDEEPLEEAITSEDVLDKVKKSFADYLSNIADEIKQDSDLKDKKKDDTDLKKKDKTDRDLIVKEKEVADESVTQESHPIKSIPLSNGVICEIHGNDASGYEIRKGSKCLPTKFKDLSHAVMALEMYNKRRHVADESQDYMEEK